MVRARERQRYLYFFQPGLFFIESSPGGSIFEFFLLFYWRILNLNSSGRAIPFTQVRPDVPEVGGDPYEREISIHTDVVIVRVQIYVR